MNDQNFVKPQYDSYCLTNIPATILSALTENQTGTQLPADCLPTKQQYKHTILFLIDGFGWNLIEKYFAKNALLKKIKKNGKITKLTSQFPSTTASNITTIHTGIPSAESGLYEWFIYEPEIDTIITPILYSFGNNQQRDNLKTTALVPEKLYPTQTFYEKLAQYQIPSFAFHPKELLDSVYSDNTLRGAQVISYRTFSEACINLNNHRQQNPQKSHYILYYDRIDTISHIYGPNSPQAQAEIENFLFILENIFFKTAQNSNTLFLLTADHGQIEVDPQKTLYLNVKYPQLEKWMKKNREGHLLVPAGSCRDFFLFMKEENLEEAYSFLSKELTEIARVIKTEKLLKEGYFGPNPSSKLLNRLGNLVILPNPGEAVWWFEKGKFEQTLYGHHGGLTKEEIEIPLLALAI